MPSRPAIALTLLALAAEAAHAQGLGSPGIGSSTGSSYGRSYSRRPPGDGPDLYGIKYDVRYDEETWDRRFVTDLLWEQKLEDRPTTGPCRIGDRIVLAFHGRAVRAYDAKDGSTVWSADVPGDVAGEIREVAGDVALTTLQGDALRLRATDGTTVFRAHLAQEIRTAPVPAAGLLLVASRDDDVFALDAKTGQVRWKASTGGKSLSAVAVSETEELVLVGDDAGVLHALSLKDGASRWTYESEAAVTTAPAVSERRAFVVTADRRLHGVDLDDGDRQWRHDLGSTAAAAPVVDDGVVIVATLDNIIGGYDADNGFREWKSKLPRRVTGPLDLREGVVYATPTAADEAIAFKAQNGYELGRARLDARDDHTVGGAAAGAGAIVMATYGKTLVAYSEITSRQVEDGEAELPAARPVDATDLEKLGGALGATGPR